MWPIRSKLRIWLHLLKKSLMENFIFCPVFSKEKPQRPNTRAMQRPDLKTTTQQCKIRNIMDLVSNLLKVL